MYKSSLKWVPNALTDARYTASSLIRPMPYSEEVKQVQKHYVCDFVTQYTHTEADPGLGGADRVKCQVLPPPPPLCGVLWAHPKKKKKRGGAEIRP